MLPESGDREENVVRQTTFSFKNLSTLHFCKYLCIFFKGPILQSYQRDKTEEQGQDKFIQVFSKTLEQKKKNGIGNRNLLPLKNK